MKIAVVGAPKSGKTDLAQSLSKKLPGKVVVVDDYIAEVEKRSDIVLGHFGTYIGNVQAAIGRFEADRLARKDADVVITCGTIIETAVYEAINAYVLAESSSSVASRAVADGRADRTMMWFGPFALDTFDYDYVFYLPLGEEFKADENNKWEAIVDDHIPECADNFGIKYVTLADPNVRVEEALAVITQGEELEAAASKQQSD